MTGDVHSKGPPHIRIGATGPYDGPDLKADRGSASVPAAEATRGGALPQATSHRQFVRRMSGSAGSCGQRPLSSFPAARPMQQRKPPLEPHQQARAWPLRNCLCAVGRWPTLTTRPMERLQLLALHPHPVAFVPLLSRPAPALSIRQLRISSGQLAC